MAPPPAGGIVGADTDRRPSREPPLRTVLIAALAALAALVPALAIPPPANAAPGGAAIARSEALEARWGLCPTARPAHRLLARARRSRAPRLRARRARAAARSWTAVARACSAPVDQPTVSPPAAP